MLTFQIVMYEGFIMIGGFISFNFTVKFVTIVLEYIFILLLVICLLYSEVLDLFLC